MRPRPRAVLFDFDFTLVDCSRAIFDCVRHACTCCGYDTPPEDFLRPMIGLTLPTVNARISGSEARQDQFVEAFLSRADEIMEPWTQMLPGAIETVAHLRALGIHTGIVSTKIRRRLEEILIRRNLRAQFDIVLGLEDVPAPKPDPAGLLQAVRFLELHPRRVLYIGDHHVDAQAAAGAGVHFLGILTGVTTREDFAALGASCIATLHDLPGILATGE